MSRAFIAFYMGDYDRDTQALSTLEHGAYFLLLKECWVHGCIPLEPARRAKIAKLSLRDWTRIAPTIDQFFDGDGRNKRATREIEKADTAMLQRAIKGRKGGLASGISRAIREAQVQPDLKHRLKQGLSTGQAQGEPGLNLYEANQNKNITSSFSGTAREGALHQTVADCSAATPAGLAKEAREAVQKTASSLGSGELEATNRKRGWVT